MIEADKLKIREAFLRAVSESSREDELIEGWTTSAGEPVTLRTLIEGILESDELYDAIDKQLASGEYTLDQIIEDNVQSIKGNSPSPA